MLFGALGDVHGDFDSVRLIMGRHQEIPFWLSVGDIADAEGRYEAFPAPLHFIKGNNEGFDALAGGQLPANLYYLANGTLQDGRRHSRCRLGRNVCAELVQHARVELASPAKGHVEGNGTGGQTPTLRA